MKKNQLCLLMAFIFIVSWQEALASMICVSQIQARLREAPSTNAPLARMIYENTPLEVLSKRGRWFEVKDYAGKSFFIFDSLVSSQRECLMILGGTRTYRHDSEEAPTHQERSLVHHLEGLQVIKKDLEFIKVLDKFGNEFWIRTDARFWPKAP